jgi:uncharacterized membrane protein
VKMPSSDAKPNAPIVTDSSGAAAILAAGIGSFALGGLACASDRLATVRNNLVFYKPTGPLSGVTTVAVLIWLLAWGILEWRWRSRTIAVGPITFVALVLLGVSLLLTFPPVVSLF